jgi:hypothetical protein
VLALTLQAVQISEVGVRVLSRTGDTLGRSTPDCASRPAAEWHEPDPICTGSVLTFRAPVEPVRCCDQRKGYASCGVTDRGRGFAADKDGVSPKVAQDSAGVLYVADGERNCVVAFDTSSGLVLRTLGGYGSEPGRFRHPVGLAVSVLRAPMNSTLNSTTGVCALLAAAPSTRNSIRVIATCLPLTSLRSADAGLVVAKVTRRGTLIVSERLGRRVQEVSLTGDPNRIWCCEEGEVARMRRTAEHRAEGDAGPTLPEALWGDPGGVAVCCRGRVFVVDSVSALDLRHRTA